MTADLTPWQWFVAAAMGIVGFVVVWGTQALIHYRATEREAKPWHAQRGDGRG